MDGAEDAFVLQCQDEALAAVLHQGREPASTRGVLIVVGGPQYRVGSHRQFVLLARALAERGHPVLRFDYRGMGDSDGVSPGFEHIGPDISAAVDAFMLRAAGLEDIAIWGLCDAASAAAIHAHADPRISGMVLANPWVRTETGEAKAYLRHYYGERLLSRDLWARIGRGEFKLRESLRGFADLLRKGLGTSPIQDDEGTFIALMEQGLRRFTGRVLLILSGRDLTAAEFQDLVAGSSAWQKLLSRPAVTRRELPDATHTFSSRQWRDEVARWTGEWLRSW